MLELEQVPVEVAAALLAFECVVMGLGTAGEVHAAAFCEGEWLVSSSRNGRRRSQRNRMMPSCQVEFLFAKGRVCRQKIQHYL